MQDTHFLILRHSKSNPNPAYGRGSFVGRMHEPGGQTVYLDQFDAMHEIMHALGFYHEHNRWDRDKHVKIFWKCPYVRDNIQNFQKRFVKLASETYGLPYDMSSVMHYPYTPIDNQLSQCSAGTRIQIKDMSKYKKYNKTDDLSEIDICKLNYLYQCPGFKCTVLLDPKQ